MDFIRFYTIEIITEEKLPVYFELSLIVFAIDQMVTEWTIILQTNNV